MLQPIPAKKVIDWIKIVTEALLAFFHRCRGCVVSIFFFFFFWGGGGGEGLGVVCLFLFLFVLRFLRKIFFFPCAVFIITISFRFPLSMSKTLAWW